MKQTFDESANHTEHAQISLNIRANLITFRFLVTKNTFENYRSKSHRINDMKNQKAKGALTETCQDMEIQFSGTSIFHTSTFATPFQVAAPNGP